MVYGIYDYSYWRLQTNKHHRGAPSCVDFPLNQSMERCCSMVLCSILKINYAGPDIDTAMVFCQL